MRGGGVVTTYTHAGTQTSLGSTSGASRFGSFTSVNVGDVIVVHAGNNGGGGSAVDPITSISFAGVTTWTQLAIASDTTNFLSAELWFGVITSATTATLTVNFTSAALLSFAIVNEFNSTDGSGWNAGPTNTQVNMVALTHGNYPSVSPSGASLFVGAMKIISNIPSGSSTGYVYDSLSNSGQSVYNLAAPSPSAPPFSISSTGSVCDLVSGLLYTTPTANSNFFAFMGD